VRASGRPAVVAAALLAAVVIPGSAQAVAGAPAQPAAAQAQAVTQARAAARAGAATRTAGAQAAAPEAACNPDDPLHPTGSLRPSGPPVVTPGSLMATIRARGYLIAGVDLTLFHLSYLNPLDGQIEGFNIDMLHAISAAIFGNPDRIRFVSLQDAARLPAVESGSVDIVAQPTTVTCARLKLVDFSTVYITTHQRVLVLDDSRVTNIGQLGGQRVCGVTGAGSFAELQALAKQPPHIIPVGMPYWTDCLVALQQGTVAAVSGDDAILAGLAAQDAAARMVGPTIVAKPQGLALSAAHPDFVRFVNAVLARWRADGGWAASYARWIGTPVPAPPPLRYAD
jgi:polar amino acid transport system substrate-binding protein